MKEHIKDGMKAIFISLIAIIIASVIIFLIIDITNGKSDEPLKSSEPIFKTITKF